MSAKRTCSIDGCEKPSRSRDWCQSHYDRWRVYGDPLMVPSVRTPEARFWEKVRALPVDDPDACWLWTAAKTAEGYGVLGVGTKNVYAHRFSYALLVGPIPPGLEPDHLCHNRDRSCQGGPTCVHRRCVNPDHLEPVTHDENVRRGQSGASGAAKTTCPQGHDYSPENTTVYRGKRRCRACNRARDAARRSRKRAS